LDHAKVIAEALNALDPHTSAEYAKLEYLTRQLPTLEAVPLHKQAEVDLWIGDQRVGLAVRADARPATAEAALLVELAAEARRVLADRRAEFVAEIKVEGSPKVALVDANDAANVIDAGPWFWRANRVINSHGVSLADFIMTPIAWAEEVVIHDPHDLRRSRLGIRPTVERITITVPASAAAAFGKMSVSELGNLVLGATA
jgi:hypothetical protein